MHRFFFVALAVCLPGCSMLYEGANEVAEGVGDGVAYYCDNTDVYVREQFGALVNNYAQPNSITVTCANGYRLDPVAPIPAPPAEAAPAPVAP